MITRDQWIKSRQSNQINTLCVYTAWTKSGENKDNINFDLFSALIQDFLKNQLIVNHILQYTIDVLDAHFAVMSVKYDQNSIRFW